MAKLSLFPLLTDELKSKIGYEPTDYSFYYTRGDELIPLSYDLVENTENIYSLKDDIKQSWDKESDNIGIQRGYCFNSFNCLFGEKGIVCSNAVIGVAVIWTSLDSKQRGVIEVGELKNNQNCTELEFDFKFNKAQLRGQITFTTILYIKKIGTPKSSEEHLANSYGIVLGEFEEDNFILSLDGIGSVFPIFEIEDPELPLWTVDCNWNDPTTEKFIDCVAININKGSKYYSSYEKDYQLLREILSSALTVIITKLQMSQNYWQATLKRNFDAGSVSEAIYYFIKTLGWNASSPEKLSYSIRSYFEKEITE